MLASRARGARSSTKGHCDRLADSAPAWDGGSDSASTICGAAFGGYLHDLGKVAVPDAILSSRGS